MPLAGNQSSLSQPCDIEYRPVIYWLYQRPIAMFCYSAQMDLPADSHRTIAESVRVRFG